MVNKIADVVARNRRFAIFPIVCVDHCAHLLNMNFAEVAFDGEKIAQVLAYGYNLYQYDMVLVFVDAYVEAQAMGCKVKFTPYPRLLESSELIRENFIKALRLKSGKIKGSRLNSGKNRTGEIIKAAKILKKKVDVPIFVSIKGPFTLAAFIYGIENFLKLLLVDDKKAKDVLERAIDFQTKYLKQLLALEVNIFIGDPLGSASVISPELFEKYACEPLGILIKKTKEENRYAGIHICGETKPIIPMLDELGADILSIEDISPKTKTLKMGGVSTTTILNSSQKEIEAEVRQAMTESYLILSTSCDVPIETKPENIKTMIEAGINL